MLGRHHALIRRLRALRNSSALRSEEGVFVAEGMHLAQAALDMRAEIEAFVVSPRTAATAGGVDLLASIRDRGAPCHHTADATLDGVQDARSPQPVVCVAKRPLYREGEIDRLLEQGSLVVVLEGIQDPGNLGTILRTVDAAGFDLAIVTGASADPYHPRAVRATMGSIFGLPVVERSTPEAVEQLRGHGYRLAGADPRGGTPFRDADLGGKLALVLGSEGGGISPGLREGLDLSLTIPLREGVESLSVGAAAAVLSFEIARQRRR